MDYIRQMLEYYSAQYRRVAFTSKKVEKFYLSEIRKVYDLYHPLNELEYE